MFSYLSSSETDVIFIAVLLSLKKEKEEKEKHELDRKFNSAGFQ